VTESGPVKEFTVESIMRKLNLNVRQAFFLRLILFGTDSAV